MKKGIKVLLILAIAFVFWILSQSGSVSLLLVVLLIYFEFFNKKSNKSKEEQKKEKNIGNAFGLKK